jgi:hypothetical protein
VRKDIIPYYRALGLSPGAEALEIRRAYRQLIQQWHPDLYKAGSPMQTTAEDITKEINEAYDQLYRKRLYKNFSQKREQKKENTKEGDSRPKKAGDSAGSSMPKEKKAARQAGEGGPPRWKTPGRNWKSAWTKPAVAIALIAAFVPFSRMLVVPWVWIPLPSTHPDRGGPLSELPIAHAQAAATVDSPSPEPQRILLAVPVSLRPTDVGPVPMATRPHPGPSVAEEAVLLAHAESLLDVIALGDTKARVIKIQGTPDEAGERIFRYGASVVYFKDGLVTGWRDRQPRLHVRDWLAAPAPSLDTFWVGSTRGDVVRAQGLPEAFDSSTYSYGSTTVFFERDRVAGWSEGDVRLRRFEMPRLPFVDLDRLELWESRSPLEF